MTQKTVPYKGKAFSELNEKQQARRIKFLKDEKAKNNLEEIFAVIGSVPKLSEVVINGKTMISARFRVNQLRKDLPSRWFTASALLPVGQEGLINYYKNLKKGTYVNIDVMTNKSDLDKEGADAKYINVFKMITKDIKPKNQEAPVENEATVNISDEDLPF